MSRIVLCTKCKHNKETFCGTQQKDYPASMECKQYIKAEYPVTTVAQGAANDTKTTEKPKLKYISTDEVYCRIFL